MTNNIPRKVTNLWVTVCGTDWRGRDSRLEAFEFDYNRWSVEEQVYRVRADAVDKEIGYFGIYRARDGNGGARLFVIWDHSLAGRNKPRGFAMIAMAPNADALAGELFESGHIGVAERLGSFFAAQCPMKPRGARSNGNGNTAAIDHTILNLMKDGSSAPVGGIRERIVDENIEYEVTDLALRRLVRQGMLAARTGKPGEVAITGKGVDYLLELDS